MYTQTFRRETPTSSVDRQTLGANNESAHGAVLIRQNGKVWRKGPESEARLSGFRYRGVVGKGVDVV